MQQRRLQRVVILGMPPVRRTDRATFDDGQQTATAPTTTTVRLPSVCDVFISAHLERTTALSIIIIIITITRRVYHVIPNLRLGYLPVLCGVRPHASSNNK